MKFSEKIKLAFYNLIRRKKTTAQCVAMVSFIMLLIFISAFFISTLVSQLNDNLYNYASRNYIKIEHSGLGNEFLEYDNILLDEENQNDLRKKFNSVDDINYYNYLSSRFHFYNPKPCDWIIDGKIYENTHREWGIAIVSKELNVPTFSKNLYLEFSKKFPKEKLIKYGRDIENNNEVLIPEEYLYYFNITYEQLLNAESVSIESVFNNVKIVGIINENVNMLNPDEDSNSPYTIYTYTGPGISFDFNLLLETPPRTFQRIELKNSNQVEDIMNYLKEIFEAKSSDGNHYNIEYGNQSKFREFNAINKVLTFIREIVLILFIVLGVGFFVFLYSVMEHSAKQKGAYWGMMRAMGEKSTLFITIIEIVIITIFAAIICLIISSIAVSFMSGMVINLSWSTYYEFTLNRNLFAVVFFITLAVELLLNSFLAFLSSRRQNSKSITAALRS